MESTDQGVLVIRSLSPAAAFSPSDPMLSVFGPQGKRELAGISQESDGPGEPAKAPS